MIVPRAGASWCLARGRWEDVWLVTPDLFHELPGWTDVVVNDTKLQSIVDWEMKVFGPFALSLSSLEALYCKSFEVDL